MGKHVGTLLFVMGLLVVSGSAIFFAVTGRAYISRTVDRAAIMERADKIDAERMKQYERIQAESLHAR